MQTEIHHCAASHGATLYYEVTGQGHPLVLLHGNGEDSTYFEHQVPRVPMAVPLVAMRRWIFIYLPMTLSPSWMTLAFKKRIFWAFRTAVTLRCIPY